MVNEPIDGSNKLRLLVQIKCWITEKKQSLGQKRTRSLQNENHRSMI